MVVCTRTRTLLLVCTNGALHPTALIIIHGFPRDLHWKKDKRKIHAQMFRFCQGCLNTHVLAAKRAKVIVPGSLYSRRAVILAHCAHRGTPSRGSSSVCSAAGEGCCRSLRPCQVRCVPLVALCVSERGRGSRERRYSLQ